MLKVSTTAKLKRSITSRRFVQVVNGRVNALNRAPNQLRQNVYYRLTCTILKGTLLNCLPSFVGMSKNGLGNCKIFEKKVFSPLFRAKTWR